MTRPGELDLVIPALNEEAAIEAIIKRCLDAAPRICSATGLNRVNVIVVSDGSKDGTEAIARRSEPAITVIAYPVNRGYGEAIKTGFAAGNGEYVAFLDADGTCDPDFFAPMLQAMNAQQAQLCIGARLTPGSRMPLIRKIGNHLWRFLINWIAQTEITDAASGMRVIRRDALPLLEPLPGGLHFTPTMSCRAALDARLKMIEVPMTYEERVGRSKLSVIRDGWRFLVTILDVGLTYQPFRMISLPGLLLLLLASWLLAPVAWFYALNRQIPEGDIYRILMVVVTFAAGLQMLLFGLAGERAVAFTHPKKWAGGPVMHWMQRTFTEGRLLAAGLLSFSAAFGLNAYGFYTRLVHGQVWQHWSRAAFGGLLVIVAVQFFVGALHERFFRLLNAGRHRA